MGSVQNACAAFGLAPEVLHVRSLAGGIVRQCIWMKIEVGDVVEADGASDSVVL
jgi:hypothetical protein